MKTNAIATKTAVRGVVYYNEDEIKNEIDNMLCNIEQCRSEIVKAHNDGNVEEYLQESADIMNTSYENVEFMYNATNTIAALVGFQENGCNRNMIIPKGCISDELVEALTPIDLGNNIIDNYMKKVFDTNVKNEIVSEEPIDEFLCVAVPSTNGKLDFNNIHKFSIDKDGNINKLE